MSEEDMNLDDILSGAERKPPEPAPEAPVPAVAAPVAPEAPQAPVERPRGPDGKFAVEPKPEAPKEAPKLETKPEAPKQEELTAKEKAFLRAAQEERQKRQELEREMAQYRQQPQQPVQPAEQPKAFLDDPDGALQRFEQGVQQVSTRTVVQTSEMIARMKHPDYDEKVAVYERLCKAQPDGGKAEFQNVLSSPDPAEYVYGKMKAMQERYEWEQGGGVEGMKAKIIADERVKWDAEQATKEKERQKLADDLPGSLSEVTGRGIRSAPMWTGPPTLDDILKH